MRNFPVFILCLTLSSATSPARPGSSPLSSLAEKMNPGTWAELKTNGFNNGAILAPGGSSDYITQYADNASWDPVSRQFLFEGMSHTNPTWTFVAYSEATNSWRTIPAHPDLAGTTVAHAYDHNTVDPATGDHFHRLYNSASVYKYATSAGTWSVLPQIPMQSRQVAGALAYFPEMGGLVFVDGDFGVWFYKASANRWRQLADTTAATNSGLPQLPMGDYNNFIQYNPVQKVVVFGGGGDSHMYKMDASGKITPLKNAPFSVGITSTLFSVDPVSGKYVVITSGGTMYEYDVADNWKALSVQVPFAHPGDGVIQAPISTHGVILYVAYDFGSSKVYLYKHSAAKTRPN